MMPLTKGRKKRRRPSPPPDELVCHNGVLVSRFGKDRGPDTQNRVIEGGKVRYAVDPVVWMLKRGSISVGLAAAGIRFREEFTEALSSNVPALDLEQPFGIGGKRPLWPAGSGTVVSWLKVQGALDSLGTADNPQRLIAWHVLGLGKSLRDFAQTVGWGGVKPRDPMAASGVLQAALATLADHYRLEN